MNKSSSDTASQRNTFSLNLIHLFDVVRRFQYSGVTDFVLVLLSQWQQSGAPYFQQSPVHSITVSNLCSIIWFNFDYLFDFINLILIWKKLFSYLCR